MSPEAINEYLARLLTKPDEDAFHSLIEGGDPVVDAITSALLTSRPDQSKLLIDVLQEIRTDRSRRTLAELSRGPFSKVWVEAVEGLFYNDPEAARLVLLDVLANADEHDKQPKSELIEELLASAAPASESPSPPRG